MKNINLSIIIPVYNVEKYISKCLESIIPQCGEQEEIIIINDGSNDNSGNIIKSFIAKNKNIRYICRENKGLLKTRIEGVKLANGSYVSFIDSDDYVSDNYIKVFYECIKDNDYSVIKYNYVKFNSNGFYIKDNYKNNMIVNNDELDKKLYRKFLTSDIFNSASVQFVKRELINLDNILDNVNMGEDMMFNMSFYHNIKNMCIIKDRLYYYRINENSISNSITIDKLLKNVKDLFVLYPFLVNYIEKYSTKSNVRKAYLRFIKKLNYAFFRIIKNGYYNQFVNVFNNSIKDDFFIKAKNNIILSDYLLLKESILIFLLKTNQKQMYIKCLKIISKFK